MSRLLYLVADLGDGGQERQLYYLTKSLIKRGHNCAVVVWDYKEDDKYVQLLHNAGVDIYPLTAIGSRKKIVELSNIVKKYKPSILQAFSFHLNFPVYLACLGKQARAIGGIRSGFDLYQKDSSLSVFLSSAFRPYFQVTNNSTYKNHFWGKGLHSVTNKVYTVSNCLDITAFPFFKLPQTNSVIHTASIGRLFPEKRIDLLIQLIKNLVAEGYNIFHTHAGAGPLLGSLQQMVKDQGLEGIFNFAGTQKNINTFLQTADFLIHTSDYEGYPNVLMEAMASGRPVLTTNCGDAALLVENEVTGYVVPTGDIASLMSRALSLMNNEPLRRKMGANARRIAEEKFSISAFTDKMLEVYANIETKK